MSEEKGIMAGTAGQGLASLKLALNLAGGKFELVPQDIGYASESSTVNLSMDDISPCQPIAPFPAALPVPQHNATKSAHSDTDSSKKSDIKKSRILPSDPNKGSLSASPNEFYYKVAPLALDIRAEALTRSARSSLSRLRAGPALVFSDDEEESKTFR